eukprot:258521-Chlamydomonas_euryale.AAC.1
MRCRRGPSHALQTWSFPCAADVVLPMCCVSPKPGRDALHTQWTEAAVAGAVPGASFMEQLSEKVSRHSLLLTCLSESGVLHSLEPEVQVSPKTLLFPPHTHTCTPAPIPSPPSSAALPYTR